MRYLIALMLLIPFMLEANEKTLPFVVNKQLPVGEFIYKNNCSYCHGNPAEGTAIAPVIYGSPLGVLSSKLRSGGYPEGYMPKRQTKEMPLFPTVNDETIIQLYMYLNYNLNVTNGD